MNCFQSTFHLRSSSEVIERSADLCQVNMWNGTFVVVGIVVVVADDDVVAGKRFRETGPNYAIQMWTDQNNIDVAGMTVKGQMKK